MLPSGNDAATCLAEWGGQFLTNEEDPEARVKFFVREMNKTCKYLGLVNTRFGNPHGLPHIESKSNANEVAKLCFFCLEDSNFTRVAGTQKFTCTVYNEAIGKSR